MITQSGKVTLSTKLFYGFGSVAVAAKDNGFNYFILFFYSQVMGLAPTLASLALVIALCFDAVSDPLVGHISDNFHSKWGRRHPFMYASIIPIAIGYFFLWNPPMDLTQTGLFWYLVVLAILVRTVVTLFQIPSDAMVAELTDNYDERTSLMSYRYFFGWWGGLTMAVSAYLIYLRDTPDYPDGMLNPAGYGYYGATGAVIVAIGILVSAMGTHKHIPFLKSPPPKEPFKLRRTARQLRETLSNKSFLWLFISALLFSVGAGVSMTLNIYFTRYFWGLSQSEILIILMSNFVSAVIALYLAPKLSAGRDKKTVAMGLWIFGALFLPFPIVLRLIGFFPAMGSDWLLPLLVAHSLIEITVLIIADILISSMVADLAEDSEKHTKRRSEGLFFAARSFAAKTVNGLGIMVAGLILEIISFPVGAKMGEVPQSSLTSLGLIYVPTIVGFYLLAVYAMSHYRITRHGHSSNITMIEAAALEDAGYDAVSGELDHSKV